VAVTLAVERISAVGTWVAVTSVAFTWAEVTSAISTAVISAEAEWVALTLPVSVDGAVVDGMPALHGMAIIGMAKTGTATTTITITSSTTAITSITASSEWAWDGGRVTMAATVMEDARGCDAKP
jgi:hypothetical protein